MRILSVLLFVVFMSCKSSSSLTDTEINNFENLVASKHFTIKNDWAYPQVTSAVSQVLNSNILPPDSNTGAINLIGNPNFLTIKKDSVSSYLPFYGERQIKVAYAGTDSAIAFNGVMENFNITTKKDRKILKFYAESNSETFNVTIILYPNKKSIINLFSASRLSIRYNGNVSFVE